LTTHAGVFITEAQVPAVLNDEFLIGDVNICVSSGRELVRVVANRIKIATLVSGGIVA